MAVPTATVDFNQQFIDDVKDPTAATHVGDRAYNDARYLELSGGSMTGALLADYGTDLLPGVAFDGDPNTGMWRQASDSIGFSTGGGERFRIGTGGLNAFVQLSVSSNLTVTDFVYLNDTGTLALSDHNGILQVGPDGSQHLGFDQDAIQSKASSAGTTLNLNPLGGTVATGSDVTVGGRLSVTTDPNSDDDVGDRGYNDTRYINVGEAPTAHTHTHNSTTSIQGGASAQYYHLTSAQHTDLTDAGASALHYHTADRARADHTGTQLHTTISDFDSGVQANTLNSLAVPTGTVDFNQQFIDDVKDPTAATHVGDRAYNDTRYINVGEAPTAHTHTHNSTTSIQGGTTAQYYHLTSTQHTDLTDGNDSTLHKHSFDRARANHTGTQAHTTILDFDAGVQTNRLDQMADPTAALNINSQNLDAVGNIDFGSSVGDKLNLYSNTFGMGIESSTLTYWSGGIHKWGVGGTSAATTTAQMTLSATQMNLQGNLLGGVGDPTDATYVGDRGYNDTRYLQVGGDTATGIVYFTNATDVNLADGTGTAQFGASGAVNIGIDGNEIQCRVGGAANTLYLQNHGGNVQLGYAIQAPAGSAASPNYAFTSDPGNGMYMSGTDNVLRFSTSGTEYMSLSSTSFTVASLQIRGVTGTASAPAFAVTGTDSGMYGDSTQLKFSVGGTEKMRLHDGVTEPIDIWSGGIDMNSNKLTDPLDPTAGTHVGDRDYNDNRYLVKIDQSDKAGNTAVSSTSYADSTIPTLTVSAATDDWLELNVSGHWNNEAIAGRLDGYIADGTDYMSGNGSGGTGHRSWAGGSSLYVPTGGSLWYKVVAANVVGGEVDVKIYIKASSASTKTLLGPVRATLINHGASG